jgi:hypothetical protein
MDSAIYNFTGKKKNKKIFLYEKLRKLPYSPRARDTQKKL